MNVRGLNDTKKRRDIFDWLRNRNYDICLLQETHATENVENKWRNEWGYTAFWSSFTGNSRGVAILFKNSFQYDLHSKMEDDTGRFILLDVTINNTRLSIVNVYGPNDDNPNFFGTLETKIQSCPSNSIIIGGDFNVVQDYTLDTLNIQTRNNPNAHDKVNDFKDEMDLHDPWRLKYPDTRMFTWHNSQNKHSRLDYFLVSSDLLNLLENPLIKPAYRSDHSVVELTLKLSSHPKGPGIWKFNNSLLSDENYINDIRVCIKETCEQYKIPNGEQSNPETDRYVINDQLLFEMLKLEIRGKTIAYSAAKKKESENTERTLNKRIEELHEIFSNSPTEENHGNLIEKQNELKALREKRVDGIIVRAKARWHLHGEKNSKYFLNLEKRHYTEKTIPKIIKDNGEETSEIKEIIKEQKLFYESLYTSRAPVLSEDLENTFFPENDNMSKLSNEASLEMEGDIKIEECYKVLKDMKKNKSPGSDGFTSEFYMFFWNDLKYQMLRSFQETFNKEMLSDSQKLGVITCLPKPGKPKEFLKNWRPISLLNVDYKILAGVIAQRIKTNLSDIISNCQKGFVSGRYIGECTRLVSDLIHYSRKNNLKGILLLIDFEKAFDSLEWSFIDRTLNHFNFGRHIRKWVKIFYTNIESCIINNGFCSERFNLQRGVRQGDPLSPYLFILGAEILARAVMKDINIKGLQIDGTEYLISQLADDTTLFLEEDEDSFNCCLKLLDKYSIISGLKINYGKTSAITLGIDHDLNYNLDIGNTIKWQSNGQFTLLGIDYDLDDEDFTKVNYTKKFKDFEKTFKDWNTRGLTIYGKVCIVKSLALPKLVHLFSSLPNPPEDILKRIESACFKFIWDGKPEKVKRSTMYNTHEKGGFKLPNIKTFCMAQKLTWIKKLLDNTNTSKWKTLFLSNTEQWGGNYIWLTQNQTPSFVRFLNPFWKDVYNAWAIFTNDSDRDPCLQTLFHNPNIKINDKSVFFYDWFIHGIRYVNDLIDETGNFYSWETFSNKFNIVNQSFRHYALIHSIPMNWKKRIKDSHQKLINTNLPHIEKIKSLKKPSKYFYLEYLEKVATRPLKAEEKWQNECGVTETEWQSLYCIPYKATTETKLRALQMKILHRILPTNKWLHQCKLIPSNNCTFCHIHIESIDHLLWDCTVTKNIWLKMIDWLKSIDINIAMPSKGQCLLGDPLNHIYFEHLKLITKEHIYMSKIQETLPSFEGLKRSICFKLKVEKCYSTKRYFNKKWDRKILEYFGL